MISSPAGCFSALYLREKQWFENVMYTAKVSLASLLTISKKNDLFNRVGQKLSVKYVQEIGDDSKSGQEQPTRTSKIALI
ncbi:MULTISPECIES: hypothetical protein [Pseudomonas syringae group]|uniref:hypothetical protein n=1 Tax=Pseudomonas syringae group TaxID=136849 RepID=UPI001672E1C9|nr:hypothetical protein [Pseudomonas amygdali]UPT38547.1 hypothetical protein LT107_08005 [Pseudomonas amygdali pv. loropetali]